MKSIIRKYIPTGPVHSKNWNMAAALIAAVMFSVPITLTAQEPERDLDRSVDVSREYLPDMERAHKLTIAPQLSDTVALHPDLEYTVTPSPWMTGFGVAAINPVKIDAASFEPLQPFYLKAGFGFPARSTVDIYGTTTSTGGGYAGGYLNHTGNWSKLRSDYGQKERALESHNKVGIFGRTYLGQKIALSAEIGYDYDIYSLYNYSRPAASRDKSSLASYSLPRLAVEIGNDFTDLSFFNFAVGAEGYLLRARSDVKESGIKAGLALGKMFGMHRLALAAKYEGAYGGGERDGYNVSIISAAPSYLLDQGRFRIGAGVDISYSKMKGGSGKVYFLPSAEAAYSIAEGALVPYAKMQSRLISNSLRSIVARNPYVIGNQAGFLHPSRDYKALAGVRGDIAANFSYELRVGGGIIRDVQYFIYDFTTGGPGYMGQFTTMAGKKVTYFTLGGSLSGRVSDSFTAGLDLDYFDYSDNDRDHAVWMPEFTGNINVAYNYREKIFIKLKGGLTGTRYGYAVAATSSGTTEAFYKSSAVFDLGLEAEYRLIKNLGIFVSGENLLNRKLNPYLGYRGFGIGIIGGVKLLF
ncbi:MAG: hypothetical protein LIO77_06960 [Rikenellaceae bacterium]|nr:hypothetical protein [Rikenellaceae bacterium]